MTVSNTNNRDEFVAGGGVEDFTYTFDCFDEDHILVYADGVLQTITVDYTVNLALKRVTTVAPGFGVGDVVIIIREVPQTQLTDYVAHGPFPAETHERALDLLCMMAQEMSEVVDRVVRVPITSLLTDLEIPEGATQLIGWDAAGTGLELYNIITDVGVITTQGDMIRGSVAGDAERFPIGAANTIPRSVAGQVAWGILSQLGNAGVVYSGDTAAIAALTGMVAGALAFDTTLGCLQRYTGAAWDTLPFDWDAFWGAGDAVHTHASAAEGGTLTTATVFPAGHVVQVVNVQTGTMATHSTVIPHDNTIPQITEGNEYMTLAITPKSAANLLLIDIVTQLSSDVGNYIVTALFQDATANALACIYCLAQADVPISLSFRHKMTAGTVIATTFRVRCGGSNAGNTTLNGQEETAYYGGTIASSITITEIQV